MKSHVHIWVGQHWYVLPPISSNYCTQINIFGMYNLKQIFCSFFQREWKLLRVACKFMARSNKGEFYTFPLLLLRLCNNVYWHVWMEHKLQFSSTACENGTFVKKQTSQFLVVLTVGIRKDIDGKNEIVDRPRGKFWRNILSTEAYCKGIGIAKDMKLNTKYIEPLPVLLHSICTCRKTIKQTLFVSKARPLQ